MQVQIKARDYKVPPTLRAFITERASKLERFLGRVDDAKLELTHQRPRTGGDRFTAQFTIATGRTILRAEEHHADAQRAVDLVVEKMRRRIGRLHGKRAEHGKRAAALADASALPELTPDDLDELGEADDDGVGDQRVVRTKRFPLKPMSSAEAVDQLELLGHDFFVFLDADTDRVNVLYRRKNGDYGLIQPS